MGKENQQIKRRCGGFSLVEILAAVAILGILAAIVQPMYRKWVAKGIQTQAKTELSQLFLSERTFKEEYKTFHWHLPLLGFVPQGITSANNYPVAATAERYYGITVPDGATISSLATLNLAAPGGYTYTDTTGFGSSGRFCGAASTSSTTMDAAYTASGLPAIADMTSTTFKAYAIGCPMSYVAAGSANVDVWTIDQGQMLVQAKAQN